MKEEKPIQLKAVDFFCCAGGVTSGFRSAGINVLGGIDIEGAYKETYEENNPGSKFYKADVSSLSPEDLEKEFSIKPNMDDLIFVGCSPCQYYTTLQTDKSKSEKGKLLLEEFQRFVEYFKPGYIFIENVPGLETREGSPLSNFKDLIHNLQYSFDQTIVNASKYNVPQSRRRFILLATRIKESISIPKGTKDLVSVRDTIGAMPPLNSGSKHENKDKHWAARLIELNKERIENTPKDGGNRLAWKNNEKLQLKCYIGKDNTFSDVYGRLFWDQPAPTITTKFHSISNGRFGHPEQNRGLSLREGALLQSFPENYKFMSESFVLVAKMIGNAVPPKLSEAIGKAIIENYTNATIQS